MNSHPVYRIDGEPWPVALFDMRSDFGLIVADVARPPSRLRAASVATLTPLIYGKEGRLLQPEPTPARLLGQPLDPGETLQGRTRRSMARFWAYFLVCEDPQRRLDVGPVVTLAHQASLVQHILRSPDLQRVLIADEVGLGKTIEAGLLVRHLLEGTPGLRILYLAPARLVANVEREFDRLQLRFRQWSASEDSTAKLDDDRVIASLDRAVHTSNFQKFVEAKPWDVVILDECHHLSAWGPDGTDSTYRFKLARQLIEKIGRDGRVILMSGTPHQGHEDRFSNLLGFLRTNPQDSAENLSGRVIYRIKDSIRDWNGRALFPGRKVNLVTRMKASPLYMEWLDAIHAHFKPKQGWSQAREAKVRAGGWRCAQAMQWAASSPQAGLGYLVRHAIRSKWTFDKTMSEALERIRPYRGGPEDEPLESIFSRIGGEVERQQRAGDIEDIEEDPGLAPEEAAGLREILEMGVEVADESGDAKWNFVWDRFLEPAGKDKVVLFAQPVETVLSISRFLKAKTGVPPALIIGQQSSGERYKQVDRFERPDGPQFLVSSRAGGEGLNLQVAHRLVNLDVPWNPMELEQRVGRIHRFGSRQTILVDTLVLADTREEHAYQVARGRLATISKILASDESFEALFSRVMGYVSGDEFQELLLRSSTGPMSPADLEALQQLVRKGFERWKSFHTKYAEQSRVGVLEAGAARWEDVSRFLQEHGGATPGGDGYRVQRFDVVAGEIQPTQEAACVLLHGDRGAFACGDYSGFHVYGPDDRRCPHLGLNTDWVATGLQGSSFPTQPVGAACLRWNGPFPVESITANQLGLLVFARHTFQRTATGTFAEFGHSLHCYLFQTNAPMREVVSGEKAKVLQGLTGASILRVQPEACPDLHKQLVDAELGLWEKLRQPSQLDRDSGLRHVVVPLLAAVVDR